jgi:hypothetical protein
MCCYSVPAEGHAGPDEEAGGRKYSETWKEAEGREGKEEEEKARETFKFCERSAFFCGE